ncbi:MAG: hypothetical protein ACKO9Z_09885 [Planctomycetota bacterium]
MFQTFTGPMLGLMVLGLHSDQEKHLSTPRFTIPVSIAPEKQNSLKEIVLFSSFNRGRSWELHSRIKPDQDGFQFVAPTDGPYWFSVAVIDLNGNMDPRDIYRAPVGQKIFVDTKKPIINFESAHRDQNYHLAWEISDENTDLSSLKFELEIEGGMSVIPIQVVPSHKGSGHFPLPPNTSGKIRLTVQDKAGNQNFSVRDIAKKPELNSTPDGFQNPSSNSMLVAVARNEQPSAANPPPPDPTPVPSNFSQPVASGIGNIPVQPLLPETSIPAGVNAPNYVNPVSLAPGTTAVNIAGSSSGATPISPTLSNRQNLPPLQVVSKRPVRADIEITRVGPSGIGLIEIWATHDEGMTWSLAATESPQFIPGQRLSVPLPVSQEGLIHGFTLIVKSKAGLGRQPPARGESPAMRIELDSTFPEATLFSPQPDPGRKDGLILTWKATDRNLTSQPIVLEWSDNREGPWNNIAGADLPNTGRYLWQVPASMPPAAFLRLSVKDQAGNVAIAQTQDPLLIDLNIPEVQVLGIQGK